MCFDRTHHESTTPIMTRICRILDVTLIEVERYKDLDEEEGSTNVRFSVDGSKKGVSSSTLSVSSNEMGNMDNVLLKSNTGTSSFFSCRACCMCRRSSPSYVHSLSCTQTSPQILQARLLHRLVVSFVDEPCYFTLQFFLLSLNILIFYSSFGRGFVISDNLY